MLNIVSLEWGSFRVTVNISKDLQVVVGEERRVHGSWMRNAVPLPVTEEVQVSGTGRRVLKKVKPWGITSKISAEVELGVSQVSVRAKTWILQDSAKSAKAV